MCLRLAGRYWKIGNHGGKSCFMQEEHVSAGVDQGCLLIYEDNSWWLNIPGFGLKSTEWLAKGVVQPNQDPLQLENVQWFIPWDKDDAPTNVLVCQQGALWLYDKLNAEMDSSVDAYNRIAEQWHERDVWQSTAASSHDDDTTEFEVEEDPIEVSSEPDEEAWWYKPKAGSLNHKVALIGAIERGEWTRVYQLCRVFLTFASHSFFKMLVHQPNSNTTLTLSLTLTTIPTPNPNPLSRRVRFKRNKEVMKYLDSHNKVVKRYGWDRRYDYK